MRREISETITNETNKLINKSSLPLWRKKRYTIRMKSDIRKELGNKLKEAREKQQLTQADVANHTDMTANYYAMVERGETNLTHDKISKLFKFLKIKASELPL